jgi:hypothetical protein
MGDVSVFVTLLLFCLCPSGLLAAGFGLGWFLRGRGGLPKLYWPNAPKPVDDDVLDD